MPTENVLIRKYLDQCRRLYFPGFFFCWRVLPLIVNNFPRWPFISALVISRFYKCCIFCWVLNVSGKSLISNISLWVANAQGLYVCLLQFSILKCEKILKKMIQFSTMCFKHNMHLEFVHVQFLWTSSANSLYLNRRYFLQFLSPAVRQKLHPYVALLSKQCWNR